jgi:hypothetical protein
MLMKRIPADEVFQAPGLTMQRRGRYVEIDTHRTPEQQAQLLAAIAEARPRMRADIEQATQQLEQLLHKYTSFDLVGHLWLTHGLFDIETYKETEATHRPHFVEHAAMLQLKDSGYQLTAELCVDQADVALAEELLKKIFDGTIMFYLTEKADPSRAASPTQLDEFRVRTLLREMTIGPPAYPQHWSALLSGLFGPPHVAARLEETLGLDLSAALQCIDAVSALMAVVLVERPAAAREQFESMKIQLATYMKTQKFDGKPEDKAMFDQLRNMKQKDRNRTMKSLAGAWVTVGISDTMSFTTDALSEKAALSKTTASRFLDAFSLPFGSAPTDYVLPSPTPAIRYRPIARVDTRYLCPMPSNLRWALKEQFEAALKTRTDWESYQKHRADFLVDEGVKAIAAILPGSQAFQNLTYVTDGQPTELDGLILFDRYGFFIEGKAGSFAAAGRRGGPSSMARSLRELVADPAEQAIRASEYIRHTEHPVFSTSDGKKVSIDKIHMKDICLITLTLDSLDVFTPDLQRLRAVGVLQPGDLPWAVCLTDLWAISELVTSPSEFTHFLRWRLAVYSAKSVSAGSDELNWFAIYLKEGPEFVNVPAGFDHLSYTSYTDAIDAYFYHRSEHRHTFAEHPSQAIPTSLRALLSSLERGQAQDFTIATEFLLDLNFSARSALGDRLAEFASPRNSAESFKLTDTDRVVVLLRGARSQKELDDQAAQHSPAHKNALVLALDSMGRHVLGWAVSVTAS